MTSAHHTRQTYRCSFCSKPQEKVQRLVAGPGGVYICNECVALCDEIMTDEVQAADTQPVTQWSTLDVADWKQVVLAW